MTGGRMGEQGDHCVGFRFLKAFLPCESKEKLIWRTHVNTSTFYTCLEITMCPS